MWAEVRPHTEALLHMLPTAAALLRREARGDSNHPMTSSLSLVGEDHEKRTPTRIIDALGEMMVARHPHHVQVFHTDAAIPFRIVLGNGEMVVSALPGNLEMLAGDLPRGFAAAMTAFLAAAQRALRMGETFLPSAIVARVLYCVALGVRQKDLQADIQANRRVFTRCPLRMHVAKRVLGCRLADDQRVPVPIGAQVFYTLCSDV